MIVYNMRYRGPYEYDKLILNVFQYHNKVLDLESEMKEKDCDLKALASQVDIMNAQVESISNQILTYKEGAQER